MDEVTIDLAEQIDAKEPWFKDGLKFKCTGCGKCCTGSPGYVYLSQIDVNRLTKHLCIEEKAFMKKYVRQVDDRISLLDIAGSHDCIFLKDNQCSVYEARPVQCRTFPWWVHVLKDKSSWEMAGKRCEGINHKDAPVVPSLLIEEQSLTYLDNLLEENFS